ncbi:MAG TPA: hypothetical protein VGL83_08115 [Stellaceae bacterium]
MDSDSSDQPTIDASDPLFSDLSGPDTAPAWASAPVTTAADLPSLGFDTSGNPLSSISSIFSSVPGWGWAVLIGLAGVLIIAKR